MELLLHFVLLVLVLLVRREGVLLDLSDGDGVKKRAKKSGNCEQDPCTIQITHLVLSLSVLSSPLSWCCRSVLPLMRALAAGPVNRAPAGQRRVARGEKGRGVGRSRRDENTTRVAITANCTPARRPIPSARVRSIAALGELRFRRQHAILLVARARPDLVGALATRGLLQAWRYLEGFSLTH